MIRRRSTAPAAGVLLLLLTLLASAARAAGGPELWPGAGAVMTAETNPTLRSGHAWVVTPLPTPDEPGHRPVFELRHLPPEQSRTAIPGRLRPVAAFSGTPEALAAWGDTVYIAFEPDAPQSAMRSDALRVRRIASIDAYLTPVGVWDYGVDRHADAEPSLSASGSIVSFIGTRRGPFVLLRDRSGVHHAFILSGGAWSPVALPSVAAEAEVAALASAEGFELLIQPSPYAAAGTDHAAPATSATLQRWSASFAPGTAQPPVITWSASPTQRLALPPSGLTTTPVFERWRCWLIDGQVIAVDTADPLLACWSLKPSGPIRLGELVPTKLAPGAVAVAAAGIVPLPGAARIGLVWDERNGAPPAAANPGLIPIAELSPSRFSIRELSVYTGRVMYDALAMTDGPISPQDFGVLGLAVIAVMMAALVFVLRSSTAKLVVLPKGTALADPGRRAMAALIDLVPGVMVASSLFSISPAEIIGWSLFSGAAGWMPVLVVLGVGAAHCTISEWLWGASMGKAITGCVVVGMSAARPVPGVRRGRASSPNKPAGAASPSAGEPKRGEIVGSVRLGRPKLWQAAVRNAVRWLVPPLAGFMMFLDPNSRHPGDVLAGTVVVQPVGEEPPEQD